MKKLIVNADDLGQTAGINKGIIQCYEQGIVTSASLMVRYPAAENAAAYAKENKGLGIGLHVDLGEWKLENEKWVPLYTVVNIEDAKAVKEEVERQLEIFYRLLGRGPTHIDSHQHVHMRKDVLEVFENIAGQMEVNLRGRGRVKYCGDFYGQLSDGSAWHEAISVEGLANIIRQIDNEFTEMACHPGLDDSIATMYRDERFTEVETLCHPRIKTEVAKAGVQLCSFEGIPFTVSKKL